MEYLEDTFLIYTVPIFTESLTVLETTSKKIYAVDNGLISANTFNLSLNFGKLLENQVYPDLRRRKKEIFYYNTSDGYENIRREERALKSAEKELGIKGRIIDREEYLKSFVKEERDF